MMQPEIRVTKMSICVLLIGVVVCLPQPPPCVPIPAGNGLAINLKNAALCSGRRLINFDNFDCSCLPMLIFFEFQKLAN